MAHTKSPHRAMMFVVAMLLLSIAAWTGAAQPSPAEQQQPALLHLEIRDAIGPATSSFFLRALERAQERNVRLVVLEMDTPGGLDSAMREMIQAILASPVPVVIYISPSGARAASAGTYLLYASHVAAMAPATNLGAATPVEIGGPSEPKKDQPRDAQKPEQPDNASERKAVNDAVSLIRGLAELRDRNADWGEAAVRQAVSLTARAALEQKVIDVVATDLQDLLSQLEGRKIKTRYGVVQLATKDLVREEFRADWRTKLLSIVTNPNVAYLLMLVGVYGLLLEGYNPGSFAPGVAGAVCLLLALYAFQILSVNYAGLALIALGIALIVAEAFAPSFGALGVGGVVAFTIGSIMLFDGQVPGFRIARGLIGGVAVTAAIGMLLTAGMFMRSRRARVATGVEQMLQEHAVALEDFDSAGRVDIRGEIWRAVTRTPVKKGARLKVLRVDGLTLEVAPGEQ
ncbi:serine protease [Steroidobacter agaridevorans]|uniref:Serine protease n=1 Tax=Steroidobacter agaridevorans TaxID=2695856 RepID=A0A829Y8G6_9GAMM|nr:nodulation protein NfeD [Steroidobacter agaridevorans]GFE79323.1 serine protease [Steroidobacter agaridevorans]GFE88328.1 serine protease [Steroidobacter agaridevorans]